MKNGRTIQYHDGAIELRLADDVSEDYWEATEGNAKRAILQLVALAKMRPDGVWDGDRQQRVRAVAGSHEPGGR